MSDIAPANYAEWRAQQSVFADMAALKWHDNESQLSLSRIPSARYPTFIIATSVLGKTDPKIGQIAASLNHRYHLKSCHSRT